MYTDFIKDQVEALSPYVERIEVVIVYNPLAEISNLIPFGGKFSHFRMYAKKNLVDIAEVPRNVKISLIPTIYIIPDGSNKTLGDKIFKNICRWIEDQNIRIDLIHAHFSWPCGYVGAKLREKYDIPLIITIHENRDWLIKEYNSKNDKIYWTWKNADVLIRVNKGEIPYLKRFNEKVCSIPNGYNTHRFFMIDKRQSHLALPELPVDKKILFTFSNLTKRKGFHYLIEAIRMIIDKRKDFVCIIGGNGEDRKNLQKQITDSKLSDYVRLIGFVPNNKINAWVNACDLFVLPSLSESFGVVQIEAMACGKPVVSTKNGGSEEIIINDKLGILVEPRDPEELAKAILQALETEWDEEYITDYVERYTCENIAREIVGIYEQVLDEIHVPGSNNYRNRM
jgi:glycosyltransferase involved in cell wall biosynthesis